MKKPGASGHSLRGYIISFSRAPISLCHIHPGTSFCGVTQMQDKTFTKAGLQDLLQQLDADVPDYLTIYSSEDSFPGYALQVALNRDLAGLAEALSSEAILRAAGSYGTGAVIFWSETQSRNLVIPPFPVPNDSVSRGKPETPQLRSLLERERLVGLVLVTWGSYGVAILKGGDVIDYKVGTGYIQKQHRKGGRSQKRFARRTEEQKKDFLRKVANRIDERFEGHRLEQIFFGGNRLIVKPLSVECKYLHSEGHRISGRFLNARHADTKTLMGSAEEIYSSLVFDF